MSSSEKIEEAPWASRAPRHSLTVSVLAAAAEHTDCTFSNLALAGRVNLEKLFDGTRYEPGTGADPLAIKRGRLFEEILKKDDYAELLNLLYEQDAALGALAATQIPPPVAA